MLESIKQAGKNLGRELDRAWEGLSEGWRELLSRSSNALTHFVRHKEEVPVIAAGTRPMPFFPRWSLLASEVEETDKELVVRIEIPGMDKEDCRISIEGNVLRVSGEKRYEREGGDRTYHVMECAYGSFQRNIPLPHNVDTERAEATYRRGVLTVRLPKAASEQSRTVPVT